MPFSVTQEISPPQSDIPLTLRLRAAIATALGAAAAHAKLLADQEDQEIENLMATIIESQVSKFSVSASYILQWKTCHFRGMQL